MKALRTRDRVAMFRWDGIATGRFWRAAMSRTNCATGTCKFLLPYIALNLLLK